MKALIACFVILTSLSGSIEIAADSHVNMSGDDFNISELLDGSCPDSAPAGGESCDHCCHAGGHYTGLIVAAAPTSLADTCNVLSFSLNPFRSRSETPPTPPPNA